MRIGGYSHINGITFFCDEVKVKAIAKKGIVKHKVDWILPKGWLRKFKGKFFLDSLLVIYYQWKVLDIKHRLILTVLLSLVILEEILNSFQINILPSWPFSMLWLYGLLALLLLCFHRKIIRLLQYHGAEHKVINCFAQHGYVNRHLARKASRFNRRCGSNLALILLLLYSVLWLLEVESILCYLLIYIIAIQLIKKVILINSKWDNYINILQRITVLEPRDEDLDLAINAFNHLLYARGLYRRALNKY